MIACNLTCAAGAMTGTDLARATTATLRRKLIHIPARAASRGRRVILHLPQAWPWQNAWSDLFDRPADPPRVAS